VTLSIFGYYTNINKILATIRKYLPHWENICNNEKIFATIRKHLQLWENIICNMRNTIKKIFATIRKYF